jgi:hypothetical protein
MRDRVQPMDPLHLPHIILHVVLGSVDRQHHVFAGGMVL